MIRPLGDRLVVKPLASEAKTKSGIFIPDTAQKQPNKGEVVAVGKGRYLYDGTMVTLEAQVGDIIYYPGFAGHHITVDEQDYIVLDEDEILCVIE